MKKLTTSIILTLIFSVFATSPALADELNGLSNEVPSVIMPVPSYPAPGNYRCGTSQYLTLILGEDGWNYQCQRVGDLLLWRYYDCNFGQNADCIQRASNSIQPEIQDRWEDYGGYSIYGSVVGYYLKTSANTNTTYTFQIALDATYTQIVYSFTATPYFDSSWNCDLRWCSMGFDISTPGSPFASWNNVNKITGSFYARATVSNSNGIATKDFGLRTLPGSQMNWNN
jgi:hypothetical protein